MDLFLLQCTRTSTLADRAAPDARTWRDQRLPGNLGITCVGAASVRFRGLHASFQLAMVRQNLRAFLMLHPGRRSPERKACPGSVFPSRQSRETGLPCPQAEEVSELVRHPKEFETDCPIGWHRGIAPQPLGPREPKARPLCPRQDRRSGVALAR